MKGNYQEEQPIMKISPEAIGSFVEEYQVLQYTIVTVHEAQSGDKEPAGDAPANNHLEAL